MRTSASTLHGCTKNSIQFLPGFSYKNEGKNGRRQPQEPNARVTGLRHLTDKQTFDECSPFNMTIFFFKKSKSNFYPRHPVVSTMNVRCYTCNMVLADKHLRFLEARRSGVSSRGALDDQGLKRMCCRIQLLTHVDVGRDLSRYGAVDRKMDDIGTMLYRHVANVRSVNCDDGSARPIVND